VDVAALKPSELILTAAAESSAVVAQRVLQARERQEARYRALGHGHIITNADCPANLLEEVASLSQKGRKLLYEVSDKLRLSARAYHRILKVARTLADLDGKNTVEPVHLAEAVSYRTAPEMLSA